MNATIPALGDDNHSHYEFNEASPKFIFDYADPNQLTFKELMSRRRERIKRMLGRLSLVKRMPRTKRF